MEINLKVDRLTKNLDSEIVQVTKPFLPDQSRYLEILEGVWERKWLTNNGPVLKNLEQRLKNYLGLEHLLYVGNGTIALQMAIKGLELRGEIITTPFSYVATTSSIVWEGCKPVFVDIDENTLNIDAEKIEESITPDTVAILATHCFGNACDIEKISEIAHRRSIKVIYDAAHCFGSKYQGKSIFSYGDISTCSLHATKLMHSVEGGLIIGQDSDLMDKIKYMRNFGHQGPEDFAGLGINGKNSEFHAAMGICVLERVDEILARKKRQCEYYDDLLKSLSIRRPQIQSGCEYNHAYYPVIFDSDAQCIEVKAALEEHNIFPRRYFYPSLSSLKYVERQETPVSDRMASAILCLPLYHDLPKEKQDQIADILFKVSN